MHLSSCTFLDAGGGEEEEALASCSSPTPATVSEVAAGRRGGGGTASRGGEESVENKRGSNLIASHHDSKILLLNDNEEVSGSSGVAYHEAFTKTAVTSRLNKKGTITAMMCGKARFGSFTFFLLLFSFINLTGSILCCSGEMLMEEGEGKGKGGGGGSRVILGTPTNEEGLLLEDKVRQYHDLKSARRSSE